jgi:hypothetical protein
MSLLDSNKKVFIDAKGQVCPYPLIIARRELKKISIGEVLEIEVDYENSALNSIPEWCLKNGVPCETIQLDDRLWRVYLQKVTD